MLFRSEEFWATRAAERAERKAEGAKVRAEKRARKDTAGQKVYGTTWDDETSAPPPPSTLD